MKDDHSTPQPDYRARRIVRAVSSLERASLLLKEQGADLTCFQNAMRLHRIAAGVQRLVPALLRMGAAMEAVESRTVGEAHHDQA
jgi:hypothetical protein